MFLSFHVVGLGAKLLFFILIAYISFFLNQPFDLFTGRMVTADWNEL